MPLFKYQQVTTPGPNGAALYFRNADIDPRATELAEVSGWRYVFVPDAAVLPEQPGEINWQPASVDDALRDQIKTTSRAVQLISEQMQQQIRSTYTIEDEQYFSRIGVGAALGAYTFQAGEMEALLAFGTHVETVRQWGRARRAELGL